MNYDWRMDLRPRNRTAATFVPPETVEETSWDILIALHGDDRCELTLEKLARRASVSWAVLNKRLAMLEARGLVTGLTNEVTRELRAALTPAGRGLLDRYLSAINDLQVGQL